MVCKIIFCSEFPDIPDKVAESQEEKEEKEQVIAKRFTFHANAIIKQM